jgi:hypothetical protein
MIETHKPSKRFGQTGSTLRAEGETQIRRYMRLSEPEQHDLFHPWPEFQDSVALDVVLVLPSIISRILVLEDVNRRITRKSKEVVRIRVRSRLSKQFSVDNSLLMRLEKSISRCDESELRKLALALGLASELGGSETAPVLKRFVSSGGDTRYRPDTKIVSKI